MGKNPLAYAGDTRDMGSTPGLGRSLGGGHGNPFQYSCLENPYGQRSLVGHSPWGRKESEATEQLNHSTAKYHFRKFRGHVWNSNMINNNIYLLRLT